MKDQVRLLRDCINKDIPAVVFQGDDKCAPEILEAALRIYEKNGCSAEFVFDFQLLINEVKAYQKESPNTVKVPGLSASEKELIRTDMNKQKEQVCHAWDQEARQSTYEEYSANKVVPGKFGIIEVGEEKTQNYGLISDRLYEHDKDTNERCWFYPLTGGCFSLDITTGARHKNTKIIGIEVTTDEVAKARYKTLLNLTDTDK